MGRFDSPGIECAGSRLIAVDLSLQRSDLNPGSIDAAAAAIAETAGLLRIDNADRPELGAVLGRAALELPP